jgi:hypothetical protein
MNVLARAVGFRWFDRDNWGWNARFTWAEISGRFGCALALCSFEEHYSLHVHLGWPNIFFRLPFLNRWHHEPHEGMESWGVSIHARDAHLNWGRYCKIVHFPWEWSHVRHDVFDKDEKRRTWKPTWSEPKEDDGRHVEYWPYRYRLRSGEIQERNATIYGEEREWRWLWFRWLPWPRKISRSINVEFDHEVGERTGSWKGGCVGCSYEWRKGETMLTALRRMEAERKFT